MIYLSYLIINTLYLGMGNIKILSFSLMEIGEEIRKARRSMDLTQEDLAKLVTNKVTGVKLSQREVSVLEKGVGNPTLNKIEAIATVLGKEWKLIDLKE